MGTIALRSSRIQVIIRWDGHTTLRTSRIQVNMRWDVQITLRSLLFKKLLGGIGKPLLQISYSSDY